MKPVLLCLTVLLLAACNTMPNPIDSAPTTTPETVIIPADLTETYTHSALGITLNFPADWTVETHDLYFQIWSPERLTPEPGKGLEVRKGTTKIEIWQHEAKGKYSTFDSYIKAHESDKEPVAGIRQMTLDGDIPAVRFQVESQLSGSLLVALFQLNGWMFTAVGYGDAAHFDDIIGTIRHADA